MNTLNDVLRVPPEHPALPGHFPGDPLVPGVVLLSLVTEAAVRGYAGLVRIKGMPTVKFHAPLRSDILVALTIVPVSRNLLKFECRTNSALIANGSIEMDVSRP